LAILSKSGLNEFQADLRSLAVLPDPGLLVIVFINSISFLEFTGIFVSILYSVAPRA